MCMWQIQVIIEFKNLPGTGVFLDKWGEQGNGEGQFINPQRIAVDSRNDIYVSEYIAFWRGLTILVYVYKNLHLLVISLNSGEN